MSKVASPLEKEPLESVEDEEGSKYTTSRLELWSYYVYYIGNNGLSGFNFGPSQFQNLLYLAGYDPKDPPFVTPCDDACVLPYLGRVRDSKSFRVDKNSIDRAIQSIQSYY